MSIQVVANTQQVAVDVESMVVRITPFAAGGPGGGIESVVAGANVTVDDTDPVNPVVSADVGTSDLATLVDTTDPRLSDARTPTAHAATHASGSTDPLTPAAIGAANISHTHTVGDLTATGTPDATTFLRGDGAWTAPSGGGVEAVVAGPGISVDVSDPLRPVVGSTGWVEIARHVATGKNDWPTFMNVPAATAWRLRWFIGYEPSLSGGLRLAIWIRFGGDSGQNYASTSGASFSGKSHLDATQMEFALVGQGGNSVGEAIFMPSNRYTPSGGFSGVMMRSSGAATTSASVAPFLFAGSYDGTDLTEWEIGTNSADGLSGAGDLWILEVFNA